MMRIRVVILMLLAASSLIVGRVGAVAPAERVCVHVHSHGGVAHEHVHSTDAHDDHPFESCDSTHNEHGHGCGDDCRCGERHEIDATRAPTTRVRDLEFVAIPVPLPFEAWCPPASARALVRATDSRAGPSDPLERLRTVVLLT